MPHYNANTIHNLNPGDLNWVQQWVSQMGLLCLSSSTRMNKKERGEPNTCTFENYSCLNSEAASPTDSL